MKTLAVLALSICLVSVAQGATIDAVRPFDANGDGRMQRDELVAYFKSVGASDTDAGAAADDALGAFGCPLPCPSGLSLKQAAEVVDEVFTPKKDNKPAAPCQYFNIKRSVADEVDPRGKERDFPAVASYVHDEHADKVDQFNVLGAVEVFNCLANGGQKQLLNTVFNPAMGFDFDLDGSKPANQSTIEASLPLAFLWIAPKDGAAISEVAVSFTPKYSTDRKFKRDDREASASLTFQSPTFAHAGLRTFLPGPNNALLILWWQPVLFAEWQDIANPGGNEDLAALPAHSSRLGFRADIILRPAKLERLAFKFKGFERRSLNGGGSHSYTESSLTYDIDPDGKAQFTTLYRHGRKPPAFGPTDKWVIGFGLQLGK